MLSNPKETISLGLKNLIDDANQHASITEEKIMKAYNYAVEVDKLDPKQAAKVLYQNLTYTPQWIRKFLPQEAKQLQIKPQKVKLTLSGNSNTKSIQEKNIVIPPREENIITIEEDFFIPPNRFRKVFLGMMKLRQTAETTGVYITKEWDVTS